MCLVLVPHLDLKFSKPHELLLQLVWECWTSRVTTAISVGVPLWSPTPVRLKLSCHSRQGIIFDEPL